ncbi:hypothetical protein XENOCAPTIV_003926 [Xenoophorus captivus]|uniref:Uncharacterized protein n=1 Tax=Xenoophorus captivus TaxID=1517983 RepID=A0ABV0QGD7_9TELE
MAPGGRSPSGMRNRTMVDLASAEKAEIKVEGKSQKLFLMTVQVQQCRRETVEKVYTQSNLVSQSENNSVWTSCIPGG